MLCMFYKYVLAFRSFFNSWTPSGAFWRFLTIVETLRHSGKTMIATALWMPFLNSTESFCAERKVVCKQHGECQV